MSVIHMCLALNFLQLVCPLLHLMRLLVVLLLGEVLLNLAQIEELGRIFEFEWERRLQVLPVLLQLLRMTSLELLNLSLILLLCLLELHVIVLIEVLVLLDMCLLDFFLALLMAKEKLLVLHVKFLLLELLDAILCHFSLYTNKRKFSLAADKYTAHFCRHIVMFKARTTK